MKTILKSRIPQTKARVRVELGKRLGKAANELRKDLASALDGGALPIASDTQALAKSLFVQSEQGSDYDSAKGAAESAYVNNASQWSDAVRENVDGTAYSPEHFKNRVAPEDTLPFDADVARAAVATMLAWGYWWEMGHKNAFTQRDEPGREWMHPFAVQWATKNLEGYFKNLV